MFGCVAEKRKGRNNWISVPLRFAPAFRPSPSSSLRNPSGVLYSLLIVCHLLSAIHSDCRPLFGIAVYPILHILQKVHHPSE